MLCSKCGIDKPIDQYNTYYHSVQQKMRTRKYCKTCFREQKRKWRERVKDKEITQPVSPEPATIDYSTNPLYKECMDCLEYKLISTDFYTRSSGKVYLNRCKQCELDLERNKRLEIIKDSCGSERVWSTPNKYEDIYQKECTFEIMKQLGYIYQEDIGVWLKPGVKELIDGKIVFLKLKEKIYKTHKNRKINEKRLQEIIQMRDNEGLLYSQIAKKLGVSITTIQKTYNQWKNMSK